jgi:hypothetical protein
MGDEGGRWWRTRPREFASEKPKTAGLEDGKKLNTRTLRNVGCGTRLRGKGACVAKVFLNRSPAYVIEFPFDH